MSCVKSVVGPSGQVLPMVWGKLIRDDAGEVTAAHPLLDHLIDVAQCWLALAGCRSVRRALNRAAQSGQSGRIKHDLRDVDLQRLAVIAFLHDVGKANASFQAKWWVLEDLPRHWPGHAGHGSDGWVLFADPSFPGVLRILDVLPMKELAAWGDGVCDLLRASISHHGRPVSDQPTAGLQAWQAVRHGNEVLYDPQVIARAIERTMRESFPLAFSDDPIPLPHTPAFVHLYAGLIQMADWLGSDTKFFPYSRPSEDRAFTAPALAVHAVRAIGLDIQPWCDALRASPPTFRAAFGLPAPRPMQAAVADPVLGPVVVLEAETGSGKTEAALWRFLALFQAGLVDSLYFALPTRTAASQIHARVLDAVQRMWPDHAPVVVRALPGYAAADEAQASRLPDFKVLWSDQPDDWLAEQRWAAESPKRFLAATIAVGTVDQVLLGALKVKHAHLRHGLLTRSLLVVDEVHASDAYMTELLTGLLAAHVTLGGQALLLSATLGASARMRYLQVGRSRDQRQGLTLAQALAVPYPAIASSAQSSYMSSPVVQGIAGAGSGKTVHWQTMDAIDDPGRVAALALGAAARGARVLVVRNTVPSAIATLRAVEEALAQQEDQGTDLLFRVAGVSTLHHSRYSREDRPLLDHEVERQFGKVRRLIDGLVLIGTQTLEQSLDIDADLLITDLCPMDVLLQRLGRLHRHVRPSVADPHDHRPLGFGEARAWVLTPARHDLAPLLKRSQHGLGPMRRANTIEGVYIDLRMLEATRRLIEAQPTRHIPADNRELVERATHPEALDAISAELGPDWESFGQEIDGRSGAHASLAREQALPYGEPYENCVVDAR